jgi:transposase-like protein
MGSTWFSKIGYYVPKGTGMKTPRFKCKACGKAFSSRTDKPNAYQKMPELNKQLFGLLVSGVSLRRAAGLLSVQYRTILLHFDYLAAAAEKQHAKFLRTVKTEFVQLDELETFIHARPCCVSVPMAVRVKTGEILGFAVAKMPAKGKLAAIGYSKYQWDIDERPAKFQAMLSSFSASLKNSITFRTDSNPAYAGWIAAVVPNANHEKVKGKGGNKKLPAGSPKGYDELFAINNTFARMRHDMNRLARKTWSTTKAISGLEKHLWLYVAWNNGYKLK